MKFTVTQTYAWYKDCVICIRRCVDDTPIVSCAFILDQITNKLCILIFWIIFAHMYIVCFHIFLPVLCAFKSIYNHYSPTPRSHTIISYCSASQPYIMVDLLMTLTHLHNLAISDHFVRLSPFVGHYNAYGYQNYIHNSATSQTDVTFDLYMALPTFFPLAWLSNFGPLCTFNTILHSYMLPVGASVSHWHIFSSNLNGLMSHVLQNKSEYPLYSSLCDISRDQPSGECSFPQDHLHWYWGWSIVARPDRPQFYTGMNIYLPLKHVKGPGIRRM